MGMASKAGSALTSKGGGGKSRSSNALGSKAASFFARQFVEFAKEYFLFKQKFVFKQVAKSTFSSRFFALGICFERRQSLSSVFGGRSSGSAAGSSFFRSGKSLFNLKLLFLPTEICFQAGYRKVLSLPIFSLRKNFFEQVAKVFLFHFWGRSSGSQPAGSSFSPRKFV